MDATTIRAMQSLAQELWRRWPELVNTEVSMGELAWLWGTERGRRTAKPDDD